MKLVFTFTHLRIRSQWRQDGRRIDFHMEGAATFVALPKLATALESVPAESVPAGTELHLNFEKLTYIDHACLDLIRNWRSQHQQAGNTVVMGWEEFRQRYDELPIESADLKKQASPGSREENSRDG